MPEYHMVYVTNDCDSHLYGDMAVHDGTVENCNRCEGEHA